MEYSNELLLTQDSLKQLLMDNKSRLQDLADELSVAVGTLKNYLYGQTLLENMPYHLHRKLTTYAQGGDILKPTKRVILSEMEFYSLAKLTGRDVTNRKRLAVSEFNKAMLTYYDRMTSDRREALEPVYFFLDLEYQDAFVNFTRLPDLELDTNSGKMLCEQYKTYTGLTDDEMDSIIQSKKEWDTDYRVCEPKLVSKVLKLKLPRMGNPIFVSVIAAKGLNMYFYFANVKYKDGHISENIIEMLHENAFTIQAQNEYSFDPTIGWVKDGFIPLTEEYVEHLQDIPFAFCDWNAFDRFESKYGRSEMRYGKEIFIRNLFTLFLDEDDLWGGISNAIIQELLTKHGNVVVPELKIQDEELANIIKNYPTLKMFRDGVYDQTVAAFMATIMVAVEGVNGMLSVMNNFPEVIVATEFSEI
jgi:hypothetical protein